jgi:hypothetical protein
LKSYTVRIKNSLRLIVDDGIELYRLDDAGEWAKVIHRILIAKGFPIAAIIPWWTTRNTYLKGATPLSMWQLHGLDSDFAVEAAAKSEPLFNRRPSRSTRIRS